MAPQSEEIPDQKYMHDKFHELTEEYQGQPIPRPDVWLGYRVFPELFEFWQGQENRLHDRIVYLPENSGGWSIRRLAP